MPPCSARIGTILPVPLGSKHRVRDAQTWTASIHLIFIYGLQ